MKSNAANSKESWFCFAEREKYDILINSKKVGGNAQKRVKDIIFQHGSIPLRSEIEKASAFIKYKPTDIEENTCSLSEAAGRDIGFSELKKNILESFKVIFSADLSESGLTDYRL